MHCFMSPSSIPLNPNQTYLPLAVRLSLYAQAVQLRNDKGWGYKRISRWLSRSRKLRVPRSTVQSWINGRQSPFGSCNVFDARPSTGLAYVMGAAFGDGSVYRSNSHYNDEVKLAVIDEDFSRSFAECLSAIFPNHAPFSISITRHDGCKRHVVRVGSTLLADFLSQRIGKLDNFIRPFAPAFLRGLFDAEGCVIVTNNRGQRMSLRVELTNSDLEILRYARKLLRLHNIDSTIGRYSRPSSVTRFIRGRPAKFASPTFWLVIRRQASLHRFRDFIGFNIGRKQRRLVFALNLIRNFGTRAAAQEWTRIYKKTGARWVERDRQL